MGARLLRSESFGFFQAPECFSDLSSHGVCLGEVDVVPGLPFGRQPLRVDMASEVQGLPGVAQLNGDANGVQFDVGGPNSVSKSLRSSPIRSAIWRAWSRCSCACSRSLSRAAATATPRTSRGQVA